MSETKHTETPWYVGNYKDGRYPIIPDCRNPIPILNTAFNGLPQETDRANAAFIVRAVNCHEELVAALSDLMACRRMVDSPAWEIAEEHARAALAKAKA
jgi:hypothetical protein